MVLFQRGGGRIDLFPRGLGTKAQPHHSGGHLFFKAKRRRHLAGFSLMAGRPRRDADARVGQIVHHVLTGVAGHGDRQHMGRGPLCDQLQVRNLRKTFHGVSLDFGHVP
ncbi:hypothetical protein SDC9_196907 [bioreactor metagenome]|uniref:Uncharacterized protein n=1 Tax=bioreactor metagenome TaxID=1076179 RepID=A0A645IDU3_9ZZZZ